MTKQELLSLLKLLSALESAMMCGSTKIPDYLHDSLSDMVSVLEREILK